jgi:hypothetical protein
VVVPQAEVVAVVGSEDMLGEPGIGLETDK